MIDALSPVKIGNVELKNRIAFPSICTYFCGADGSVSDDFLEYVRQRAAGGLGLLVIPGNVHPANSAGRPSIAEDRFTDGWRRMADIVHSYQAKIFCQMHPVHLTNSEGKRLEDPSDYTLEDLKRIADYYGAAALRLREAGVDGCEIQSCHERYIADFLTARANHRTDEYGGSVRGRAKLALDILDSIKRNAGPDFPVVFKISSSEKTKNGRELPESLELIRILCDAGADGITVTIGMTESEEIKCAPMDMEDCLNRDAAKAVKNMVRVPVILVDRIVTVEEANQLVRDGYADMVMMGRAHLADPELINKYTGVNPDPAVQCVGCNQGCRKGAVGARTKIQCMQNPFLGSGSSMRLREVPEKAKSRRIVIAGSGPAGLETACLLTKQGFRPVIYEKADAAGGLVRLAEMPPHKANMRRVISCREDYLEAHGIEIRLNCEYTAEAAEKDSPDAVFICTGGNPLIVPIPGIRNEHVLTGDQVFRGQIPEGKRIAVLGGGLIGCETAEYLAANFGKEVEIFELRDDIAVDLVKSRRIFMLKRMKELGIDAHVNARVTEIRENNDKTMTVTALLPEGEKIFSGYDGIVCALGRTSERTLSDALKNSSYQGAVYEVGDARRPSFAMDAIADAAETVYRFLEEIS